MPALSFAQAARTILFALAILCLGLPALAWGQGGIINFTQSVSEVAENGGTANFTLTRVGGSTGAVTARITLTDITTTPADYRLPQGGGRDDTFDTRTRGPNGTVHGLVMQTDGKVVIVGSFTTVSGVARARIARLNTDGSVDSSFNPGNGPNYHVDSIGIQSDGKIVIGGQFTSVDGTSRNGIARLNANGSLDTGFSPGTGFAGTFGVRVNALVIQPDGKIFACGRFDSFDGTARSNVARLNANGSLDTGFNPGSGVNGILYAATRQPWDGKIIVGGSFNLVSGTTRNNIARLNANGSHDTSFNPGTGPNGGVACLALQSTGWIIMGGSFSTVNGQLRSGIARLYSTGGVDGFNLPGPDRLNGTISALAIQSDDKVIVGGSFQDYASTFSGHVARLNATSGAFDSSFDTGAGLTGFATNSVIWGPSVSALAIQTNGRIIIGGVFGSYDSTSRNSVVRVLTDGSVDQSFGQPNRGTRYYRVNDIKVQNDGKILIGGTFPVLGERRRGIARLNADATLDSSFDPGTGTDYSVEAIAIQNDGKVLIGGSFSTVDGTPRNGIARLNANGSLDTSFDPGSGPNGQVNALAIQSDGKILIGGWFTSFDGTPINRIARLNIDGTLDNTFNPGTGANGRVESIAIQTDGKIVIGGWFNSINGVSTGPIARLNVNGSHDTGFYVGGGGIVYSIAIQNDGRIVASGNAVLLRFNTDGSLHMVANVPNVYDVAIQSDGKFVIGGNFTSIGPTSRNRIARLNADGTHDTGFDPGAGANQEVYAIAIQNDGKVLIGGEFFEFDGEDIDCLARIDTEWVVHWPSGDASNRVIELPIVDNFLPQPDRRLQLSLSIVSGSATIGTTHTHTLTILDDDKVPTIDDVTSPQADGTYGTGATLNVDIRFSNRVLVTGSPTIELNSSGTASYLSGSGTDMLRFRYTVSAGENAANLNYVATNSLTLNGGTISGHFHTANLTLPAPGGAGSLGANKNLVIDTTAPTLTLHTLVGDPTNATSFSVTATFDEAVTGFTLGGVSVSNGSASNFVAVSATVYTFDVTPLADGLVTVEVPAGVAQDIAANGNAAATPLTRTYDSTPPTVALSTSATDPTNASSFPVTATFSEPVTGLTLMGVAVTNGSASNLQAVSTLVYTFDVTPASDGLVTITVAAGAAQDAAGNGNMAATPLSRLYDGTSPTVLLDSTADDPTDVSPIEVTATFSEPVFGFSLSAIAVTRGKAGNLVALNSTTYTFDVTPTSKGLVTITLLAGAAQDPAGNASLASGPLTRTYNGLVPAPSGGCATVSRSHGWLTPLVLLLLLTLAGHARSRRHLADSHLSQTSLQPSEGR